MFCEPSQFDSVHTLETNCQTIKNELDALVPGEFVEWPERQLHGHGFRTVFGLVAFGKPLTANCARCRAHGRVAPIHPRHEHGGVFRTQRRGRRSRPHRGYTNQVLRCHLGLITVPQAGIRVGHEVRTWEAGKCLVFDDTTEHEAWNRGSQTRIVLLVDFAKPGVGDPYSEAIPLQTRTVVETLLTRQQKF